jgi:hypothetical protein
MLAGRPMMNGCVRRDPEPFEITRINGPGQYSITSADRGPDLLLPQLLVFFSRAARFDRVGAPAALYWLNSYGYDRSDTMTAAYKLMSRLRSTGLTAAVLCYCCPHQHTQSGNCARSSFETMPA